MNVVAALILFFVAAHPRAGYVCAENAGGGRCYGALGGPQSARFQSYSWGGEVFLATYGGQSFRCAATGPQVFARAAAATGTIVVTWDQYHRCTNVEVVD